MALYWIGYLLTAWLAADFAAGFWHWLEDRYFDAKWPLIGEYIAKPNELHHAQPNAFLAGSYLHRNWTAIVPGMLVAAIAIAVGWYWLAWVAVFASQANEIHAWAHQKGKCSRWVEILQETGFLQSPRHHGEHHRSPFEIKYCVSTDWLNPILDAVGLWRFAETTVAKLTGLKPKES